MTFTCPNILHRTSTFHSLTHSFFHSYISKLSRGLSMAAESCTQAIPPCNLSATSYLSRTQSSTTATLASLLFLKYIKHTPASGPSLSLLVLPGKLYSPVTHCIHLSAHMLPRKRGCPRPWHHHPSGSVLLSLFFSKTLTSIYLFIICLPQLEYKPHNKRGSFFSFVSPVLRKEPDT